MIGSSKKVMLTWSVILVLSLSVATAMTTFSNDDISSSTNPDLAVYEENLTMSDDPRVGEETQITIPIHQQGLTDARAYHDGDYGEYDFHLDRSKTIDIKVKVAAVSGEPVSDTGFRAKLDGETLVSKDITPGYEVVTIQDVSVSQGEHTLRVAQTTDGYHENLKFDWIKFGDIHREAELFDRTGSYTGDPEGGYDQIFPHGIEAKLYVDGEKIDELERIGTDSRYLPRLDNVSFGPSDSTLNFIPNGEEKVVSFRWKPESPGHHELKINITANYREEDSDYDNNEFEKTIILDDAEPERPHVGFENDPEVPEASEDIKFTDTSVDPDGDIVRWEWTFGDGETSTEKDPVHSYSDDGVYTVKLTVIDDDGLTNFTEKDITVTNNGPEAQFSVDPNEPYNGEEVRFTDRSEDVDGEIVNWTWTFGDDSVSYSQNPEHSFEDDGSYDVRLEVTDDDGSTSGITREIDVKNRQPEAEIEVYREIDVSLRVAGVPNNTVTAVISHHGNVLADLEATRTADEPDTDNCTILLQKDESYDLELKYEAEIEGANPTWVYFSSTNESDDVFVTFNTENGYEQTRDIVIDEMLTDVVKGERNCVFSAEHSSDSDGKIESYVWDFDDGSSDIGEEVSHEFEETRRYNVTLKVIDDDGAEDMDSVDVEVSDGADKKVGESSALPVSEYISQGGIEAGTILIAVGISLMMIFFSVGLVYYMDEKQ